jgi:hypothetical protein
MPSISDALGQTAVMWTVDSDNEVNQDRLSNITKSFSLTGRGPLTELRLCTQHGCFCHPLTTTIYGQRQSAGCSRC